MQGWGETIIVVTLYRAVSCPFIYCVMVIDVWNGHGYAFEHYNNIMIMLKAFCSMENYNGNENIS